MRDPVNDREPTTADPPGEDAPDSRGRGALAVGVMVFVICVGIMLLPLVIPFGALAKFVVAPAFIGACIGVSITANAAIDWWRWRWRRK
jgi:hypothetical protein